MCIQYLQMFDNHRLKRIEESLFNSCGYILDTFCNVTRSKRLLMSLKYMLSSLHVSNTPGDQLDSNYCSDAKKPLSLLMYSINSSPPHIITLTSCSLLGFRKNNCNLIFVVPLVSIKAI